MTQHFRPSDPGLAIKDLSRYLTRVLPSPGHAHINVHYTFMPKDGLRPGQEKLPWGGVACKTVDEAVNEILRATKNPYTRDIYVCLSTQREVIVVESKAGHKWLKPVRLAENAVQLKSLWLDIDAKNSGNGYPTLERAVEAVKKFIADSGMPKPSVIVRSGAGLHVYWSFDRALNPQEWFELASALTEAGDRHGLQFDHISTDAARVLRPPGTFNYKTDPARPVTLAGAGKDYTVEEITKALEPYKVEATFLAAKSDYAFIEDPALFPRRAPIAGTCDLSAGIETTMPRDQVRRCLEAIPNDKVDWNFWNTVGMRVFAATEGAEYGLEEWRSWSEKNKTIANATDNCDARWTTLHASPPNRTGAGALINQARQALGDPAWLPHPAPVTPRVTSAAAMPPPSAAWDPLDFIMTTTDDAVPRINTEYFFRRDTSEICRQDAASGEIQVLTLQQFKTALAGRWVDAVDPKTHEPKVRDAATVWVESRKRREIHGVQYCPNNVGLRQRYLNLWLGWEIQGGSGDCSIVLDHIHQVIANGDLQKAEFILNWCADIVQNPTRKPGVALVLRGPEGNGKSVLGAILRRLLGARNVVVNADKERLLGRFNSALASKILIQAEESFFYGDSRTADALKHLITGQTMAIEIKFGRNFEINSFHRLLITSNHAQVIQASSEARRFVVCDVSDARRGDTPYFDRLYAVADGPDDAPARAFMQHLLERDLSHFQPWAAQQLFLGDKALIVQKGLSLSPPLAWLREVLEAVDGECAPSERSGWHEGKPTCGKWMPKFPRSQAIGAFRDWVKVAKPHGANAYTGSEQRFWSEIARVIPRRFTTAKDASGNRSVTISLADVRACFRRYMQGETNV